MKEQELSFKHNTDATIVQMTEIEKKERLSTIVELFHLASYMHEQIKEDKLEEGFKETQLSLLENLTEIILKDFNYDSVLQKEKEERYVKIRSLNMENEELRKQLGNKATAEDVRESLKNMENNFREFWKDIGFGYCKDFFFGGYGLKVKISTSMLSAMLNGTDEKIKERKSQFKDYGFELVNDGEEEDNALSFCQKNIDILKKLLSEYFSDFDISSIDSYARRKGTVFIKDMDLYIRNFDDLLYLDFRK